jgi:3-hydroxymyristoyl/3-hydroxydecanoyl-(acyl carrier protein) dehydratase
MHHIHLTVATKHPAFAGHFPGQPVLPGVSLLAEVMEAALDQPAFAAVIGPAPRIANVKFLAPVRPGAQLVVQLEATARGLRFEVHDPANTARVFAMGQFEGRA